MPRKQARFGQPAVYNETPPTLSDGEDSALNVDASGYLRIVSAGSGSSSSQVQGATAEQTGLSAGSLNADLVPSTDVTSYRSFSLHIQGTFSGTLTLQGSNDNSDWRSVPGIFSTSTQNTYSSTFTAQGIVNGPVFYKYFRVRMTAYTSGTATGTLELYGFPFTPYTMGVNASSSGTFTVTDRGSASTPARIATSTTSATLIASNSSRKEVVIVNDSSSTLYAKFGATATATDYTYMISPGQTIIEDKYTGRIDGILNAGTGSAQVSEVA